ncbi:MULTISPECIES: FAD-dependent thymidylate synthase [unclassified Moraxella]|uniref:FAD-dependent thymidylate synthase n=1 Tax=unclassified Moraxella TaxID=2685852 RepID=UPI002B41122D|nr:MULTISPECIES: FAD-dependent thymidylate synthase [unclassified Moraxella]
MIKATIVADSISAHTNTRITTFELEYHRFIHCELLTHRQFSRNASSSRAIPIDKMIDQVALNSAMPIHWGLNQSGMQAKDEQADVDACKEAWCNARDSAIYHAYQLKNLGLHKQIVNRVLEPFQMMKTLVTATNFDNFFNLRCHEDAQPEIKQLADLMYQAMQESTPEVLYAGEWHTPYVYHERDETTKEIMYFILNNKGNEIYLTELDAIRVSCSCSAQVSYRKNDTSIEKALAIYDKLVNSEPVHASAFEHCATPIDPSEEEEVREHNGITHWSHDDTGFIACSGNFTNWVQYRQLIPNHDCKQYRGE